jgi:hypothetical protein
MKAPNGLQCQLARKMQRHHRFYNNIYRNLLLLRIRSAERYGVATEMW